MWARRSAGHSTQHMELKKERKSERRASTTFGFSFVCKSSESCAEFRAERVANTTFEYSKGRASTTSEFYFVCIRSESCAECRAESNASTIFKLLDVFIHCISFEYCAK